MRKYDSFKDSGVEWIGEIPCHWNKVSLGKLGVLYGGLTGKSGDDFRSENHPSNKSFIPFTNISNNTYISKDHFQYVVVRDNENQNKVEKYDLFFLMSSEDYEGLGKSSILIDDVGEVYLNSFCKGFRVNRDDVYPLFLNYQLFGHTHKKLISVEGNGFTRINLRQDRLKETPIFIPPLSEQQQIVSFLDTKTSLIDSLIEKTKRKIELLKEKRTSLINEVVTKGLNPNVEMKDSGVEWIGEIPSHWEKSKLKHKGVFFSGYSFDSNDFLSEGEIRVLKISNIQNNGISWDDLQYLPESFYDTHQNFIVNKGDLVFVLTRPIISSGIKVCFFNEEFKTLLNQRNSVFRPNESSVIKRFLFYSVRTFSFIEEFKQQLKETNQPNISTEQISNILIFFPSLSEQHQIVSYLDEQTQLIDKTISIEEKRIELLKEYRQSLISEVVTGKLKVTTDE